MTWETSSCDAFDSPTNDASVNIVTNNDSLAVGTDTARAELLIQSSGGFDIIQGSYQLSIDYLGGVQTTDCIDWDASAQEIEGALEVLDNIDSVRVDYVKTDKEGDHSVSRRRFTIYFDGNGMHTDGSIAFPGFDPTHSSNFGVVIGGSDGGGGGGASSSCEPFKAFEDNVLVEFDSIGDAEASVTIESTYQGGASTFSASASDLTIHDVAASLLDAMPMHFHSMLVARSLEDDESGFTYTLTFGEDSGNVAGLVCNEDPVFSLLETATCTARTVMDGNALSGYFYVDSSEPIPHDASAAHMEAAIEGINGIDDVSVTRSEPDGQEGYSWDVTFESTNFAGGTGTIGVGGDVNDLAVYSSLQGKDATVRVQEIIKGNEIGGTFTLSYGDDDTTTTEPIPFDATADEIKDFIDNSGLDVLVGVESTNPLVDSESGRSFRVTFLDHHSDYSSDGDRPLLQADLSQVSGVGAVASVREEVKGSSARGDSLFVSYEMPDHSFGSPITRTTIQSDLHEEFIGDAREIQLDADYTVQIVSIRNSGVAALSGSFRLSYGDEITDDIPVNAEEKQIKMALENFRSINTVGVVQNDGGWTITFHSVVENVVKPLLSGGSIGQAQSNDLFPRNASVEIRLPNCSKCLYMANLLPWKEYHVRARVANEQGPSDWDQTIGTAMSVPSAPTHTRLDVVSGECLELFFTAPVDSGAISSYLIQYALAQEFSSPLGSMSITCDVPSCQQLICGLDHGEQYYVRIAAVNEVQVQGNRKWSVLKSISLVDIAPNAPVDLAVSAWSRKGLQVIINPPIRDGGSKIEAFMIELNFNL